MAANGSTFYDLPFDEPKSRRCVHPRVRCNDERARQRPSEGNHHAGKYVRLRTQPVPAAQYKPRKMASRKNAKPSSEGMPMTGPANAMNVGHNRPSSSDSTVRTPRPRRTESPFRAPSVLQIQVFRPRAEPCNFGRNHHHGHGHPDDGKDNVERERQAHLPPRIEKVHIAALCRPPLSTGLAHAQIDSDRGCPSRCSIISVSARPTSLSAEATPSAPAFRRAARRAGHRARASTWMPGFSFLRMPNRLAAIRHADRRENQIVRRKPRPVQRVAMRRIAVNGTHSLFPKLAHGVHVHVDDDRLEPILTKQARHRASSRSIAHDDGTMRGVCSWRRMSGRSGRNRPIDDAPKQRMCQRPPVHGLMRR